jgi:hypothetical protein
MAEQTDHYTVEEANEVLREVVAYLEETEGDLRPANPNQADALKRARKELYLVVSPAGRTDVQEGDDVTEVQETETEETAEADQS